MDNFRKRVMDNSNSRIDIGGHEAVLIGNLLWATCNVGADTETDRGKLYAWGETTGYAAGSNHNFSSSNYKYNGSNPTKYNSTDGKKTLDSSDDAATVSWGNGWRMPTPTELTLYIGADSTYTTRKTVTTIDGVDGVKIQNYGANVDSDPYIFIPFGGFKMNSTAQLTGTCIYLWSNRLYSGMTTHASSVLFANTDSIGSSTGTARYYGLSIRPVHDLLT